MNQIEKEDFSNAIKSARRKKDVFNILLEMCNIILINDYSKNKWQSKLYSQLAKRSNLRKLLFSTDLTKSNEEIIKQQFSKNYEEVTSNKTKRDIVYPEDIPPTSFLISEKWNECSEIFNHIIKNGECSNSCWAITAAESISSRICVKKVNTFRQKIRKWSEQTDILSNDSIFLWDFANLLGTLNEDLVKLRNIPSAFVKEEESLRQSWTILLMLEWKNTRKLTFFTMKEKLDALEEFLKWTEDKNMLFYKAMDKENKNKLITEYWCQSIERELDNHDKESTNLEKLKGSKNELDCLDLEIKSVGWNEETSTSDNFRTYGWSLSLMKIFKSKLNNTDNIVSAIDLITSTDTSIKKCNEKGSPAKAFANSIEIGILSETNTNKNASSSKPYPDTDLIKDKESNSSPKQGIVRLFIQWENHERDNESSKDAKRYHLFKFFSERKDFIKRVKKEIMREGPVVAFLSSSYSFTTYNTGIYQRNEKLKQFDQNNPIDKGNTKRSILIIGWGKTEEGNDYWICKASMFTGWGEDNVNNFRILQGNNELEIEEMIMFPEIYDPETWHITPFEVKN